MLRSGQVRDPRSSFVAFLVVVVQGNRTAACDRGVVRGVGTIVERRETGGSKLVWATLQRVLSLSFAWIGLLQRRSPAERQRSIRTWLTITGSQSFRSIKPVRLAAVRRDECAIRLFDVILADCQPVVRRKDNILPAGELDLRPIRQSHPDTPAQWCLFLSSSSDRCSFGIYPSMAQ